MIHPRLKKFKVLRIHAALLFNVVFDQPAGCYMTHDLEPGTEIAGVALNENTNEICMKLWNDKWPEVDDGENLEEVKINFFQSYIQPPIPQTSPVIQCEANPPQTTFREFL